jgi:ABC-2 type transport system permease protein
LRVLQLIGHQMRYDLRAELRNPAAVFFGLALPVIFLLIFATLFGEGSVAEGGEEVPLVSYYVPGIIALGIVSNTYVNLAIGLTFRRESGLLKRLRATPLPLTVFMLGRSAVQIALAFAIAAVIALVGYVVYGVGLPAAAFAPMALVIAVGGVVFAALGIALSALIPGEDAAPAITNFTVLPLYFVSGVFVPVDQAPPWIGTVASLFPVKPLVDGLVAATGPAGLAPSVDLAALAVLSAWGIAGALLALRFFRWSPRTD